MCMPRNRGHGRCSATSPPPGPHAAPSRSLNSPAPRLPPRALPPAVPRAPPDLASLFCLNMCHVPSRPRPRPPPRPCPGKRPRPVLPSPLSSAPVGQVLVHVEGADDGRRVGQPRRLNHHVVKLLAPLVLQMWARQAGAASKQCALSVLSSVPWAPGNRWRAQRGGAAVMRLTRRLRAAMRSSRTVQHRQPLLSCTMVSRVPSSTSCLATSSLSMSISPNCKASSVVGCVPGQRWRDVRSRRAGLRTHLVLDDGDAAAVVVGQQVVEQRLHVSERRGGHHHTRRAMRWRRPACSNPCCAASNATAPSAPSASHRLASAQEAGDHLRPQERKIGNAPVGLPQARTTRGDDATEHLMTEYSP